MKKNGYLRKFVAMFLVFVMLMADSSMTTFAGVVGRAVQQNADEDIAVQSANNDVNVTVTAPDGTYYVKLKQKENEWWASDIARASVQVQNGKGTCSLDGSNLDDSKENWLEIGLQENGSFVKSGEVLRSEGKIYSVTESNHAFTVNEISIQPGTQRNFKDILGSATNFGIVANEATFKGHLESNFAIGKLNYEGTNVQMSKNEGGGAGYNYIGEFVGSSQLQIGLNGNAGGSVVYAGKEVEGKLTTDSSDLLLDYDTYTKDEIKMIVKNMVDEIKNTSATLYNENSVPYQAVTDISTSGNQYTNINIAKYGKDAGTYYVSFQPGEFSTFMNSTNCKITVREDQNIVLNIPDTNVDFKQFTFIVEDATGNVVYQRTTNANSDEDRVAENVIFNCPYATTAATYTSTGIFLVPNATFTNAIVSAGWVIADTIAAIGGQEWHNVYKGMPVVETTFQIKATKNVDNAPATDEKYDGKFSFELQEKDGENWKTIDSVTNTGSAIVFDNLGKFGTEGTHYYKIVETASALSDVTIDGEPVYVKAVIKKNGNKMVATVTYYSDENYATEVSDPSFNNTTVITEKTEVSVEKKWADNENQDRVRPGSIQVQLYADGTAQGEPIELNEDNGWKYTWSNLEKKSGSNDIEYTVDEVSVPAGYTKTVTANEGKTEYTITNTHTTEKTEATVKKVWDDSNDQDGLRPTSIIVNLLADGNATGTTVTLNEDNGWAATVQNLPKKANGTDIVYSWSEGNMPEGYSLTDTAKDGTVTTLTNSYSTEETSVSVRKVWTDSDNQDGIRPESISVQLKADGKASGDPVVLNEANNWSHTWTKLAKNANKTAINYTVDEVSVPAGYTKTVTANEGKTEYTITNTHTTETTEATIRKVWDDSNDQDGKRPESLSVNLMNGNTVVDTVTLTADNNWTATVQNLPKKANGTDITYTWSEGSMPEGYSLSGTAVNGTVTTLTNSYSTEETSVSVRKVWTDSDNQDGIRPESISVQLKADGKASGDPVVLSTANNWTYTWTKLAKNANKTAINYTVDEVSVPAGYTKTVTANEGKTEYTITNTHTTETTEATIRKVWDDSNDQDGKRPDSLSVKLMKGNTVVTTVTLNEDNGWAATVNNLPKKANGTDIVYSWSEGNMPEGYSLTDTAKDGTVTTLTNSYSTEETSVSVRKVWADSDNQDGIRPESISVQLKADGKASGDPVVLNEANNWTYTWTKLAKNANKTAINYTVDEVSVPSGYTKTVTANEGKTEYTITNTHTTETTEATIRKVWDDSNDQDGNRPESLSVNLMNGNTVVDTVTLTADNNWTATVQNLPKKANGTDIVYSWSEGNMPEGYSLTGTAKDGTVTTLTNSYSTEETSVSVRKVWDDNDNQDGKRPNEIKVQLKADGKASGDPVVLNEANNWTYTWTKLAKNANKTEIAYTVDEVSVPSGYTKTVTKESTGYVITNTHTTETTEATIRKVWDDSNDQDGNRPESLSVNLMNGNTVVDTVTLTADNNWTATVQNLPKKANGTDITYTWSEGSMPEGYSLTDTAKDGTVTTLTNSYSTEETSVSVRKVWTDSDNQDGIRPESISVQLKADGKASGDPVVLSAANNWTYTWTKLAKNANKTEIQYTVDEVSVPEGYTKAVTKETTGYVITNTHETEKTEATVKKVWDDSNDQDGNRPESLSVNLMNGNTVVDTVTLTADNNWTATVQNLPKKANGTDIVYSWSEGNMPEGYSLTDTAKDGTVTTLTNSYSTEETSVSVRKVWTDSDNQDGIRPESISVQLKADGKASGDPVVLNEANNWTYTWTKLAKNANKTAINYTVDEVSIPSGYTKTVTKESTGYVITNTHETEMTSINGTKTWNDNDNQDGIRPTSITVNLLANGTKVDSKEVTANDNWKYEFTNLPKYAAGNEISYTIEEDAVDGYTATVDDYNITNTHKPETTKVEGSKTWNDNNNQDGIRPDSITVNLFANGVKVKSQEVTVANDWKYTFDDLDKYENGNEIIYTVSEELVNGYVAIVDDYNITNTHNVAKTEVSGIKTWNDGNDQDGIRPSKITVNLLADGTKVDSKEVTADNNWAYSFTDLPKYADGKEIAYTVTEDKVDGYETTVNGFNILNTHIPETTEVSGTKTWVDNDDQDGKRPTSITVNLLANGEKVRSQVVTAAGNWTYNFTDLPKYADGKEITYTVEEVAVADYTTEINGYDIINTHKPETTEVSGTKTWDDSNDQDGKRPESITVNLLANGEKVDSKEVTADNNWTYSFTDLPVYKAGQKLTYTVSEETVADYTTTYDGTNIKNSYTPGKTSATVTKVWKDAENQDGKRPESITVSLLADGKATGKTVTLSADNNWTETVTDLDEKANGKEIAYTWTEENLPEGYELTGNTTDGKVTTLTNEYAPETTSISGSKTWNDNDDQDGKRPESITVNLLAGETVIASQTVTAATNWNYVFENLPVYANGQKITYTVTENAVADYTTEINGYDITNTHTTETTSVEGKKVWNDANDQDGKRPESITVRLLANGTEVASQEVTADNNWSYSFTDLPKYEAGKEIVYTVKEDVVADYTTTIDGTTITNSYKPGKTSITVTKAWVDNDNQDGIRPESIKVQLYAGDAVQGKEITLNAENNWTYTWNDLDEKKNGQDIAYTVKEVGEVTGYTSEISGDAQTGYVITNTHKPETTSVEGQKVWDDADNQDGKRPESITVRLLADGKETAVKEVTAADNWAYSFTDLPKFADGKEIVYTVKEDVVADYTTTIDGTTITNSYKPGKTSITVTKAWVDNDNQDGIRPESIKVQLYAGDAAQGKEVTLNAENKWTYTWNDLDEKKGGKDIVYTVRETEVPAGYEATVTGNATEGFILTNTHKTEVISVEGTKTWNDNDQLAKRPESITVRLLADGTEVNSQTVNAESNWTYKFTDLPKYAAGKEIVYTVSEDAVPGYLTAVNGNNLINTITSVKVSKVDITDQKELAGAHIQVLDKDGNIVDEWDSTWEAHEVTGLKTNEKYTLRETVAPDGYTVTSDTTFTLKEDGTVDKDNTQTTVSDDGTLLVEDSKTSVRVSKVDIVDGKELEGAHIQILDEDENIVAEWDSTKEPHVIEGLKTGKKYTLRETVAPTGYELTSDTTFVLKADGTVDAENTTTISKDGVLLVQDKLATGQSIAVTKKLTTITGDLKAMDQTFYVALYSDEACTQRVSDVKAIEFKNASSSTVVFDENIEVNKDYYIAECSQDGTAQSMGALADGTMYEAKFNDGNKATVKEANGTTTVYFDNVFSSIPDGYYKQGKITITKKLLGADGNAKKSNNVFYAGIFDDADHTQLSTQVQQNIVKLDLAGGSEVSQVIKVGLDENKAVTLYVTETDSNGKPIAGTSGFAYKVSVDGSTVTIDEANENASVTITNTENPTTPTTKITTEESSNESGSSASSHSMSSSTKAPKTGDNTPIAMYVIILIAAAALIVFAFAKRRKKNQK